MPQVDLEALVSVCGGSTITSDRKVAGEPLVDDHNNPDDISDATPPESFWLSKDAEFDWFDRNAFLERKESTRGNSNSTANHSNNNSQRFSLNIKSKTTAILGLPKTQKRSCYVDKRRQCKPTNIRMFPPKRSESVGKSTGAMAEPSSPKVSCMGRVRSKRGRRRKQATTETKCLKSVEKTRSNQSNNNNKNDDDNVLKKKKGFCSSFISLFRRGKTGGSKNCNDQVSVKSSRKSSIAIRNKSFDHEKEAVTEAPSLGGMTRFVSGRRSEEVDVAKRASVDLGRSRSVRQAESMD